MLANLTSLGAPFSSEIPFYQNAFNLYNTAPGAANAQSLTTYSNFFYGTPKNNLAENLATARLDYKLGTNDNVFAHFKWDHGVQPTHVDPINPIFNAQSDQPDYEGQLEETHTFSSNVGEPVPLLSRLVQRLFPQRKPGASDGHVPLHYGLC